MPAERELVMENFAFAYWWLIFPIMWMLSRMVGMWFAHRRQHDTLELMKTSAAQGRDPSELARTLDCGPGPGEGADWRWRRRAWRYTPFWAWRRAIMTACVAAGFWWAAEYLDTPWGWHLEVLAVIMTIIAVGSLVSAVFSSLFAPKLGEA